MVKPNSLSKKPRTGSPVKGKAPAVKPKPTRSKGASGASGPARAASGDAEKRILAAARKEFVVKGIDGARMQIIATEAGVNKALLHYYYRSKDKLYQKVLEDTIGTIWVKLQEEFRAQDPAKGLEPLIRAAVGTYIRTLRSNPDFPLFVFRAISGGGQAVVAAMQELVRDFKDVPVTLLDSLKEEIRAGKVKPIHPIHFLMSLMGMTVATFLMMPMIQKLGPAFGVKIEFDEEFQEERIRSITDTLLNGIRIKRLT